MVNLRYRISRLAMRVGAIVTCATMMLNSTIFGLDTIKVSASSCTFVGGAGCTCGGSEVSPIIWNQTSYGNAVNANWSSMILGSGTMAGIGCYVTSIAQCMGMSGDFGKMCPATLLNWAKSTGNLLSGDMVSDLYDVANVEGYENIMKVLAVDDSIVSSIDFSRGSIDDRYYESSCEKMYQMAVDLAEAGVYVILRVQYNDVAGGNRDGQHFMPVVGVIEADNAIGKELIVGDPGDAQIEATGMGKGERFCYSTADYAKEVEGYPVLSKKSYDAKNICNIRLLVSATPFSGGVNATNTATQAEKAEQALVNYGKFVDYLEQEYFLDEADIAKMGELALTLPNEVTAISDLGYSGIEEVDNWSTMVDGRREDRLHSSIRAIFAFIGIVIVVYSTLLFIAYQADKVNNFFDVSLLGILTFNRLGVSPEESASTYSTAESETKLLNFRDICVVTVAGIAIGVLIISGKIFLLISALMNVITKIFEELGGITS